MAKTETNILKRVMLRLSACRLFRNNVGLFTTDTGDKIRTGLCKGSSDLIGWTSIKVTPEMVGKMVCIFTAAEIKSKTGRASASQNNFMYHVNDSGGIAFLARSPDEAEIRLLERIGRLRDGKSGV